MIAVFPDHTHLLFEHIATQRITYLFVLIKLRIGVLDDVSATSLTAITYIELFKSEPEGVFGLNQSCPCTYANITY